MRLSFFAAALLLGQLISADPAYAWSHGTPAAGSPSLAFTALANGSVSSTVAGSGTYTIAAPSGLTSATWGGNCSGSSTVSGFSAGAGVWSATFTTPAGSGAVCTITATGTGGNTNTVTSPGAAISGGGGVTITGVTLSNAAFNTNTLNAAIGTISVQTTGGAFSGSLSLGTAGGCPGTDNASLQIASTTLESNGSPLWQGGSGAAGAFVGCIVATQAGATGSPFSQAVSIAGVQAPGPSSALWANPYYSCTRNYYVNSSTGNNTWDGTSATFVSGTTGPWLTIAKADSASRTGGDCVNVAAGTYAAANANLAHGGTAASSTGYLAYRCSALDACTITDTFKPFCGGLNCGGVYPNYIIFDGFNFSSASPTLGNAQAISCYNGDTGTVASGCHHWWAINNIITGYGQTGVQLNDTEYVYVNHNTISQTSHDCQAAQGSGVSLATLKVISGYTPTADDTNNPRMGVLGPAFPFYDTINFNTISNAYIGCTSGNSDGNGIIRDENGNTVPYVHPSLVSFNVVYNNGGNGIHIFNGGFATSSNNSTYNNSLDTHNTGTARAGIDDNGVNDGHNTFINNISFAIPGSSPLNHNAAYLGTASTDVFTSNVSFCATNPTGGCNAMFSGAVFSSAANKVATNPGWVDVGSTSPGTISTPPVGVNFSLSGGSAAIGYGVTHTYLSPEAADAGACSHLLLVCP